MATIDVATIRGAQNWTDASIWQGGVVPGAGDTAVIELHSDYEVQITSAVTVQELDYGWRNSALIESGSGSITAHAFRIVDGSAVFENANSFDYVGVDGGTVFMGNDHALGTKALHTGGGTIADDGLNINLHNKLDMQQGASFAATAGHTLTVSGIMEFDPIFANSQVAFLFGAMNSNHWHTPQFGGTVDITGTTFDIGGQPNTTEYINIDHGIVKSGKGAHSAAANAMFSDATEVVMLGGTLDVRNFGADVTLHKLEGLSGEVLGNSSVDIHAIDPNYKGTLDNVTMELSGTGLIGGNMEHSRFTMAAGTNTMDFSAATAGDVTISAPDGSSSTITVGAKTWEHFTDFQDGNIVVDTTTASTAHFDFVAEPTDLKLVIHPGGGAKAYDLFFNGLASSDGITVGDDGHGHLEVTWTGAGGIPAQSDHAIDVINHAAQAAFVPLVHDGF
ncbi:MAG: hypothetical protein ACREHE_07460 [Rhizomicrobium sp.]